MHAPVTQSAVMRPEVMRPEVLCPSKGRPPDSAHSQRFEQVTFQRSNTE